jgi:hypothetical protein
MAKPNARELLDRNVSAAYVQQAAESMQALAARVEKVLDYCEREMRHRYPGAWALDILAKLNGEE